MEELSQQQESQGSRDPMAALTESFDQPNYPGRMRGLGLGGAERKRRGKRSGSESTNSQYQSSASSLETRIRAAEERAREAEERARVAEERVREQQERMTQREDELIQSQNDLRRMVEDMKRLEENRQRRESQGYNAAMNPWSQHQSGGFMPYYPHMPPPHQPYYPAVDMPRPYEGRGFSSFAPSSSECRGFPAVMQRTPSFAPSPSASRAFVPFRASLSPTNPAPLPDLNVNQPRGQESSSDEDDDA